MTDELLDEYEAKILPVLELAKKAYGSRSTASPQHDASRQYTQYLVEYYSKGGSILKLASRIDVTYAGIRRRITTSEIPAKPKGKRSRATKETMMLAAIDIATAKASGDTEKYHEAIYDAYEIQGISLAKIAKALGLSSANPLYYAVSKIKLSKEDIV